MKEVKNKLSFKISLLSISIFLAMAPQIASAIPLIYKAFPDVSKSGIEMLVTIPNFGIMVGLFLSPMLIRFVGQKMTIIIGLLITLLAGTFPMFTNSFNFIIISRFILGCGTGLFNSLAVSLIPQFYSDNETERANMLGLQNVMGGIGGAVVSVLMSYLVTVSWQAPFSIYFLVIPSLIAFILFVPLEKSTGGVEQGGQKEKQSINKKVAIIATLMFFIFIFFLPISYKVPLLLVEKNIGDASTAALISAVSTLAGIPVGASFGFIFKTLRDKIFPLGFALVTLGFFGMAFSSNFVMLLASILTTGVGAGIALPYMYNWLGWAAPQNSINLSTTVVLVMVNIGCFVSPEVMGFLTNLVGSTASHTLILSGIGFTFITLYAIVHYINVHKLVKK